MDDIVYEYANQIENGDAKKGILDFAKKLKTYYPPYSQFVAAFKMLGYSKKVKSYKTSSKKRDVQYILRTFENYWQSGNHELSVDMFTIEHIGCDNGTEAHCRIGNLLPLAESVNGKIGDMPFVQKITYYRSSNFVSVRNFVSRYSEKTNWTEQDIDNRATHMANLAYNKIWHIDGIMPDIE